jgi:hypothetical protein
MILGVVTGVFGSLALITVLLRLYTRLPPLKIAFLWDDALFLAATVCPRNRVMSNLELTLDTNISRSLWWHIQCSNTNVSCGTLFCSWEANVYLVITYGLGTDIYTIPHSDISPLSKVSSWSADILDTLLTTTVRIYQRDTLRLDNLRYEDVNRRLLLADFPRPRI